MFLSFETYIARQLVIAPSMLSWEFEAPLVISMFLRVENMPCSATHDRPSNAPAVIPNIKNSLSRASFELPEH